MAVAALERTRERSETMPDRLEGLFDAHHERLHRLAQRLSRDAEEARDLVQETFLRAARRVDSVPEGRSGEEAWLVRVLVNLCRDQRRRQRVRGRLEALPDDPPDGASSPEQSAVARATVRQALAQLSPRRRAVVVMHELEEKSVEEIARLLGIARVTVRWHLAAARRHLAEILKTQGTSRTRTS
jgi:RNA polymerase sigma-70 factor, ECF subfamily